MKIMYEERLKSGINPLICVICWVVGVYVFHIIWGISEILFEFSLPIVKYGIMIFVTAVFGWFLNTKVITEYKVSVGNGKITVDKVSSRRKSVPVVLVAIPNVVSVYEGKKLNAKYKSSKCFSFTRPLQKGTTVYIIFKDDKNFVAVKLKGSKKLVSVLKKRGTEE